MRHVLAAEQFSRADLLQIMDQAAEMEKIIAAGGSRMAAGKLLATFFYEPSTRTRLSFETAMQRLGGSVISTSNATFSSVTKGETVEDTVRILAGYADVIAMRSKEKGYAARGAKVSSVPILNAGDGPGEHPTQSLLDLYTIKKEFGLERPLRVVFVGDLKYGRTVHSLSQILRNFSNVSIDWVGPAELAIQPEYTAEGDRFFTELTDEVLESVDVLYDTRVQEERFADHDEYLRLRDVYIIDPEKVSKMKPDAIIMHPLPRVNEITASVDALPQARYFQQAINGVPVRMALIARALELI